MVRAGSGFLSWNMRDQVKRRLDLARLPVLHHRDWDHPRQGRDIGVHNIKSGLADSTSSDAVLEAIREFDEIGQQAFLDKYGFSPSKAFGKS